jgi:hypothetical protein
MVLPVGRIQETGNAAPLPSVPAGVGGGYYLEVWITGRYAETSEPSPLTTPAKPKPRSCH